MNLSSESSTSEYALDALYSDSFKTTVYVEGIHVHAEVDLEYRSPSSGASSRHVTLHAYLDRGTEVYLVGYCHLRREVRTFKASQVVSFGASDRWSGGALREWLQSLDQIQDEQIVESRLAALERSRPKFVKKYDLELAVRLVQDFLSERLDELAERGWHIEHEGAGVTFWRRKKNGVRLKHPHASLQFVEFVESRALTEEGQWVLGERYPNALPWVVRTKSAGERAFPEYEVAMSELSKFLLSPNPPLESAA